MRFIQIQTLLFSLVVLSGQVLEAMTFQRASSVKKDSGFQEEEVLGETPKTSSPSSTSQDQKSSSTAPQKHVFDPNSLKNSDRLWIDAEALFWQSNVGSLDYGITSSSTSTINHGRVKHPEFDWDWGCRVGLGYKIPHDKWDLFANYTYIHGHGHGHAGGSDHVVFPVFATNASSRSPFFANSAKAHWDMNLNMGDIELGRTCFVGRWLTIRPFLGVRGVVIDQDYHVEYQGGTVAPGDKDKLHLDTDFWGVGLRFGANTLWGLGCGLSIYGNGSASLLSGNFDVKERERLKKADLLIMNAKRDVDNVVAEANLALGLQWDYLFSKDRFHVGVKLGWELEMFFDQNQLFNFAGASPGFFQTHRDDLSFQGVTLGFRLDF